jgi:glycerol kinase
MSLLKQGEFVGSLDCGTTYVVVFLTTANVPLYRLDSSVRFMIFDQYANVVAQAQAEFPQYYPNPG